MQVTLQFSKEAAYRVYDEFDMEQIKRRKNGDLLEKSFPVNLLVKAGALFHYIFDNIFVCLIKCELADR